MEIAAKSHTYFPCVLYALAKCKVISRTRVPLIGAVFVRLCRAPRTRARRVRPMDPAHPSDLSVIVSTFAQPAGVAALFALAIYLGARLVTAGIGAMREVELARLAIQQTMAEAVRAGAAAGETQAAAVRDLAMRVGASEIVLQRILQVISEGRHDAD